MRLMRFWAVVLVVSLNVWTGWGQAVPSTAYSRGLLRATDASAARTVLGVTATPPVYNNAQFQENASDELEIKPGAIGTNLLDATVTAPYQKPHRVYAIDGDSTTTGVSANSWIASWTNQFFKESFALSGHIDRITFKAWSGRTIANVLNDYDANFTAVKPTAGQEGYFICYIGINGQDPALFTSYTEGLSNIWRKARLDGYKVVAFTIYQHFGSYANEAASTNYIRMNNWIRRAVDSDRKPLWDYLVDFERIFPDLNVLEGDDLHPGVAGGNLMGRAINQAIVSKSPAATPLYPLGVTEGVFASSVGAAPAGYEMPKGALYTDRATGKLYVNTSPVTEVATVPNLLIVSNQVAGVWGRLYGGEDRTVVVSGAGTESANVTYYQFDAVTWTNLSMSIRLLDGVYYLGNTELSSEYYKATSLLGPWGPTELEDGAEPFPTSTYGPPLSVLVVRGVTANQGFGIPQVDVWPTNLFALGSATTTNWHLLNWHGLPTLGATNHLAGGWLTKALWP